MVMIPCYEKAPENGNNHCSPGPVFFASFPEKIKPLSRERIPLSLLITFHIPGLNSRPPQSLWKMIF